MRFLNCYSKWLLPQLILYHPKYVARDIEVTKSFLELGAAPVDICSAGIRGVHIAVSTGSP